MRDFIDFEHYVFDLYGTLISIHTDESSKELWRWMADWYAAFGADWRPAEMYGRYRRMVKEEEALLARRTGCAHPEIRLEEVFLRLLKEAEHTHPAARAPRGDGEEAAWAVATANGFRVRSRYWMKLYPGVAALLCALRERGKGVYLLSNAQAVFTVPEIEQCGLMEAFDDIRLSSDFGVQKPEPSFLGDLMRDRGMRAEDVLMIGNDWRADMGIAAANHVSGICIDTYKLSRRQRQEERRRLAERYSPEDAARLGEAPTIAQLLQRL